MRASRPSGDAVSALLPELDGAVGRSGGNAAEHRRLAMAIAQLAQRQLDRLTELASGAPHPQAFRREPRGTRSSRTSPSPAARPSEGRTRMRGPNAGGMSGSEASRSGVDPRRSPDRVQDVRRLGRMQHLVQKDAGDHLDGVGVCPTRDRVQGSCTAGSSPVGPTEDASEGSRSF